MKSKINTTAIDIGKLICAYAVVAIHTKSFSEILGGIMIDCIRYGQGFLSLIFLCAADFSLG